MSLANRLYMVMRDGLALTLSGPYQYPEWVMFGSGFCPDGLSYAKACQCAQAFGGVVQPIPAYATMMSTSDGAR